MSEGVVGIFRRNAVRFALTGIVGIWLSGCADATRFADSPNPFSSNPFSNPFSTASNDSAAPTPKISSRPLADARPYNRSYATAARPSPVAVAAAPTPSLRSTGSIRPNPQPVGGSSAGWTAVGGSPIVVAQGDDAASLSARYGVPEAALLSANGLRSRSEIRPNMRIVVPVFNARGGGARVASADEGRGAHETHDTHDRQARDRDAHERARHADRREADDEEADHNRRRSDRADADRGENRKHRADAKRSQDDAEADDSRAGKKLAKAERLKKDEKNHAKDEKVAKAEKVEKSEKRAKEAAKAAKEETEVAKVEPAKPAHKAAIDKAPTGNVASASTSGSSESGDFRWPARGRIIQGFKVGGNDGINIALPEGTSVRAAEDGKVAYAGSALKGYGNLVLIRHPNGFVSAYANNGELDVKSGDVVKRGQVIAKSGQTGDVSSPQLHFELRKGQTPVNPTNYLAGL